MASQSSSLEAFNVGHDSSSSYYVSMQQVCTYVHVTYFVHVVVNGDMYYIGKQAYIHRMYIVMY